MIAVFWFIYERIDSSNSLNEPSIVKAVRVRSGVAPDTTFVLRSGSSLLLDGKPFRFSGANIYWLGLQETAQGMSYPTSFSVDDALATASFMGATVVRSHTLGISVGCSLCLEPALNVFNAQAWRSIDYAIASAHAHHIRLIIPFTDNWRYYHGGKHTFVEWRGLSNELDFYSQTQIIQDFEHYISTLLNHVNSYTGLAYKDDPTILAWETGNELSAPSSWVQQIATYIKNRDSHHLVMDGNYEDANQVTNFSSDLSIPSVDIFTGHYYPPSHSALLQASEQAHMAQKVFIVGEYDWNTNVGDALSDFLSTIEKNTIAGDMYWSLFSHDNQHGFVYQSEHFTLHFPGYTPDVRERIRQIQSHAYTMQKVTPPTTLAPGTPFITSISGNTLLWRGAYGADTYTIERSTQGEKGPWLVVCDRCVTDFTFFWQDRQLSGQVVYRMRGYSESGVPGPYSPLYWSTYP